MNKKLKWSSLMGPCTRERAMEIIQRKRKGARLPTISELLDYKEWGSPFFSQDSWDRRYWTSDENSTYGRSGDVIHLNAPKDEKAHFAIVWEV